MKEFIFINNTNYGNSESWIYHFFNNATISVLIAAGIAFFLYERQKKIDRLHSKQDEIVSKFISINKKIYYLSYGFGSGASLGKEFKKQPQRKDIEKMIDNESEELSKTMTKDIPAILGEIDILMCVYFIDEKEVYNLYESFVDELTIFYNDIHSKVAKRCGLEKINHNKIDESIKNIINKIYEVKKLRSDKINQNPKTTQNQTPIPQNKKTKTQHKEQ